MAFCQEPERHTAQRQCEKTAERWETLSAVCSGRSRLNRGIPVSTSAEARLCASRGLIATEFHVERPKPHPCTKSVPYPGNTFIIL